MLNVFPGGANLTFSDDEARAFPTIKVPAAASPLRMKFLRSLDNVFMCLCVYVFMLGTLITTSYDDLYTLSPQTSISYTPLYPIPYTLFPIPLYLYTFIPLALYALIPIHLYTFTPIYLYPIPLLHLYRLKFRKRSLKLRQVGGFVERAYPIGLHPVLLDFGMLPCSVKGIIRNPFKRDQDP